MRRGVLRRGRGRSWVSRLAGAVRSTVPDLGRLRSL